jgi:hypothetical protein
VSACVDQHADSHGWWFAVGTPHSKTSRDASQHSTARLASDTMDICICDVQDLTTSFIVEARPKEHPCTHVPCKHLLAQGQSMSVALPKCLSLSDLTAQTLNGNGQSGTVRGQYTGQPGAIRAPGLRMTRFIPCMQAIGRPPSKPGTTRAEKSWQQRCTSPHPALSVPILAKCRGRCYVCLVCSKSQPFLVASLSCLADAAHTVHESCGVIPLTKLLLLCMQCS